MNTTSIEWTDATWNPVRGCSRVSPGCENCYAERVAARFSGPGQPYEGLAEMTPHGPRWTRKVRLVPERLADPVRWRKPRRIFVNSMSDLFHEGLSNEEIAAVFGVMAACPQHTFQVLTKRAKRMREWFRWADAHPHWDGSPNGGGPADIDRSWPLPNVWLGVSVEDQQRANERIPYLLDTPATVRFLSCEPLIGAVDLWAWLRTYVGIPARPGLDWIIVGGESGPGARPCDLAWVRSIVAQCRDARVPCFVKQIGAAASDPENGLAGDKLKVHPDALALVSRRQLRDSKGGDPSEWPSDLRVREFPEVRNGNR